MSPYFEFSLIVKRDCQLSERYWSSLYKSLFFLKDNGFGECKYIIGPNQDLPGNISLMWNKQTLQPKFSPDSWSGVLINFTSETDSSFNQKCPVVWWLSESLTEVINIALISAGGIEQEGLLLLSLLSSVIDIFICETLGYALVATKSKKLFLASRSKLSSQSHWPWCHLKGQH